ncbi:MAG TPA: glycosyltransferase [Candidatus Nanopelagicales bacterium]|nr:glycosyltransferase [Candidatus Nanopelagicales bacterium]
MAIPLSIPWLNLRGEAEQANKGARRGSAARTGGAPGVSPARVAHVVLTLNMGGLERMVLRLLERTDRARFEPILCALDEPGELAAELPRLGVPVVTLGRAPGIDLKLARRLSSWLEEERVEIIHTHNSGPHFYGSLAANMMFLRTGRRPRVIHTKHGPELSPSRWQPRMNQLSGLLSDRVIAVSSHTRDEVIQTERVRSDKVLTILNGVDPSEFAPGRDPRAARARLGVPLDGIHIGCVARLSPIKDHATLIDAFARLKGRLPAVHLTLVGDGETRRDLEHRIQQHGLQGAVTFAGTRHDVHEILPAFDMFAMSSLTEGISLTLIEAAAAGLPIVATRVGGNPEIIDELESGILVPPRNPSALAEALFLVAVNPERARMGQRARERVIERFSADKMAEAYQDLYAELLKR